MHNVLAAAVSQDGTSFFYSNPLQLRADHRDEEGAPTHRLPWYSCACCPPNLARLHASLPGYAAAIDDEGLRLVLLGTTLIDLPASGRLKVESDYPRDGRVRLTAHGTADGLTVRLPVPQWVPAEKVLEVAVCDGDAARSVEIRSADGWWPIRVEEGELRRGRGAPQREGARRG